MIKLLNILVDTTPGLNYHLKHKLPLSENIYRYSSKGFLELFTEARTLHRNGFLQLCEADRILLEETNIGEYGIFEGQQVPLDLPMIYEEENTTLPRAGEQGGNIRRNMTVTDRDNNQLRIVDITDNKIVLKPTSYSGQTIVFPDNYDQFAKIFQFWDYFNLVKINEQGQDTSWNRGKDTVTLEDILDLTNNITITQYSTEKLANVVLNWDNNPEEIQRISQVEISEQYPILIMVDQRGKIQWILDGNHRAQKALRSKAKTIPAKLIKPSDLTPVAKQVLLGIVDPKITEAKYQGKEVALGKPHRGGSKKFFVYVRDPKTKNIKKVNFGDTTGLSVKIDDPKARHAFAARHKCALEKNKLSANYWGCHIGRYWKSLGGAKNFSGYW